jgi:hypothetical protein
MTMTPIKILNETAEEIEYLSESVNGTNVTKIRGLFTTVESKNKNGRTYPKAIFEREVNRLQEAILKSSVLGELEHPQRTTVDYENAVDKTVLNMTFLKCFFKLSLLMIY